jgi:hypothetical protein
LRAHHIGKDRHDDLHAVDLHNLAHRGDRAFRVAFAVLDDQRKRASVDAARLVDVLRCDFDRRYDQLAPGALRTAQRIGDADFIWCTTCLLRQSGAHRRQAKNDCARSSQESTTIASDTHDLLLPVRLYAPPKTKARPLMIGRDAS